VLLLGPVVTLAGAAPGLHHIAFRIEFDDRGRRHAALRSRWIGGGELLAARETSRALDDPDVVALIDRDATDLPERPVVGQGLRTERVGLEFRHIGRDRNGRRGGERRPNPKPHPGGCHAHVQSSLLFSVGWIVVRFAWTWKQSCDGSAAATCPGHARTL